VRKPEGERLFEWSDGRIILKWIVKKWNGNTWAGFLWIRIWKNCRVLLIGFYKMPDISWIDA
jgi:hypothetical protein